MIKQAIHEHQDLKLLSCIDLWQGRGGENFKIVFQVKNESKIGSFCFTDEMGSTCIAAKKGQACRCIFSCGKTGRALLGRRKIGRLLCPPKNAQGNHWVSFCIQWNNTPPVEGKVIPLGKRNFLSLVLLEKTHQNTRN